MDIAELSRRLENMIRFGTVAEVDHAARRVRVQSGDLLTDWLKWRVDRAGDTSTWDPPTIGEQVMILSPSGEIGNGIVMQSIYSDAHNAPDSSPDTHVIDYPDGARISYNHASGALEATGITTALVEASESITARAGTMVTIDAPDTTITGNLLVQQAAVIQGLLTYQAGLAGTGGGAGNVITGNFVQTDGQLSSNGIVLDSHTHTGVTAGPASTGGPQ